MSGAFFILTITEDREFFKEFISDLISVFVSFSQLVIHNSLFFLGEEAPNTSISKNLR